MTWKQIDCLVIIVLIASISSVVFSLITGIYWIAMTVNGLCVVVCLTLLFFLPTDHY